MTNNLIQCEILSTKDATQEIVWLAPDGNVVLTEITALEDYLALKASGHVQMVLEKEEYAN